METQQKSSIVEITSIVYFLSLILFAAQYTLNAQSSTPETVDQENQFYTFNPEYPYQHVSEGIIKEIYISPSTKATHLYLKVKGADGGYNLKLSGLKNGGGFGALASGFFQIGTGNGQIPPGSTLRLIPGQRGRSHFRDSGPTGGGSAGGGGGGSGVVLLPAGKTNWTTEGIVLMIAGGGGGGAETTPGRSGNTLKTGSGGFNTCGDDLNNGGGLNQPGKTSNDASPGAAMSRSADLGNATCYDENKSPAQKGLPEGGVGSNCVCWGGFGFGGGGSGNTAGGGGGGYSGGGPGYYAGAGEGECPGGAGGGGGGGSYVTSSLTVEQDTIVGYGATPSPYDGYITYGLMDLKSIQFAYNTNNCIDDNQSGTVNGNNIQRHKCNDTYAQKWLILNNRTIRSMLDINKCVDLSAGNTSNGTNIQLWDCQGGNANQFWVYNGLYKTIHSGKNSDKCLDAVNGTAYSTSTVNIQLWDCKYSNNNQKWKIDGATTISNPSSVQYIISVIAPSFAVHSHTGAELGSNIQLWTKDNTDTAEQWYFDGLAIKMRNNQNLCIDLSGSNTSNGNNIQLYSCNGTNAQKWIYDGMTQSIRSVIDPDKCMQFTKNTDGVYGKRSNLEIYDCNGSDEQRFIIQE